MERLHRTDQARESQVGAACVTVTHTRCFKAVRGGGQVCRNKTLWQSVQK